jgi:hypothetical protein
MELVQLLALSEIKEETVLDNELKQCLDKLMTINSRIPLPGQHSSSASATATTTAAAAAAAFSGSTLSSTNSTAPKQSSPDLTWRVYLYVTPREANSKSKSDSSRLGGANSNLKWLVERDQVELRLPILHPIFSMRSKIAMQFFIEVPNPSASSDS